MCRPDKWDSIGDEYDNTWGILNKSCKSLGYPLSICVSHILLIHCVFFFQLKYVCPLLRKKLIFFNATLLFPLSTRVGKS